MEVIETHRLVLRPYEDADAERVLDIHSRLEVVRWMGNPPFVLMQTLDEARGQIAEWAAKDAADEHVVHYAVVPKETGVLAGGVTMTRLPQDPDSGCEVGWHLHPDSAGHGYATEAAEALLDAVIPTGPELVWCTMYPDNEASARVAQRLGLEDLGIRPDPWYGGDSHLFRTTRDEWIARDRSA